MKRFVVIAVLVTLAACGADSPPMEPQANLGVSVGSDGVTTGASVGASNGTVSFGLNL